MRIVAGVARGRRLAGPPTGTRPTSDRMREALFSSLEANRSLTGTRVLDLYAGTGAVGLEALSRGAARVVLVESHRAALAVLRRNVATLGLSGASVVARAVEGYLAAEQPEPFDVVFADPPYAVDDTALRDVLGLLGARGWLADGAEVVVERPARNGPPDLAVDPITPVRERRYGDGLLWYGRRQ